MKFSRSSARTGSGETRPRRSYAAIRAVVVVAVLSVAASAWGLDKNDIYNLQTAGVGPDVMVNVVRSSADISMTPADIDEMRTAGVPEPVLQELCLRVPGCGQQPTGPGPVGPTGGPNLEQELERQRQLEEERRRIEQERIEREQELMRQRMEAERQRQGVPAAGAQALAGADREYRRENYGRAAAQYNEVLEAGQVARESDEYKRALWGFVSSMHKLGFRHTIRNEALEVLLEGPSGENFEEALDVVIDVANDTGYMGPQLEDLTGFAVGSLSNRVQDRFNYFMGRFFFVYGQHDRALEYLSRVNDVSDERGQAYYLSAVMYLERQENRRAVQSFQNAIVATDENGSDPEVAELSYLAIARIAYEIGNFDGALFNYRRVPVESHRHVDARFESTWTYFLKQDHNRTLGAIHGMTSPYYDTRFFPELRVIEAATYLEVCDLDSAVLALEAFTTEVSTLQAPVQEFVANTTSPDAYWEAMDTYYDRFGTADAVPLPVEAIRFVISDVEYHNQVGHIAQLESEKARLTTNAATMGSFGESALQAIEIDLRNMRLDAGLTISGLLLDFDTELTDWRVKAQEVGIEITAARLDATRATMEGQTAEDTAGTSVFVLAEDWQYWPFEGEYWADEVDNYRGNVRGNRDEAGRCLVDLEALPE